MIETFPLAIDTLTINEGTAQLIIGLMGIIPWSGIRLRSPAVMVAWMLTVVVLVLTFITDLPLVLAHDHPRRVHSLTGGGSTLPDQLTRDSLSEARQ